MSIRGRCDVSVLVCVAFAVLALAGCGGSDVDPFEESLYQSLLANRISAELPTTPESEIPSRERQMVKHIEESLRLSQQVSDDFLRAKHPDLPHQYRNNLMEGRRLYLEGVRGQNVTQQLRSNAMLAEWQQFYLQHRDAILK
jgi:hypothetical protein